MSWRRRLAGHGAAWAFLLSGCLGPLGGTPTTGKPFAESFEADAVVPAGWEVHAGVWATGVEDGAPDGARVLKGVGAPESQGLVLAASHGTFADVRMDVSVWFPDADAVAGLVVHASGADSAYVCRFAPDGFGVRFLRLDDGEHVDYRETKEAVIPRGEWVPVSLEVASGTLLFSVAGEAVAAMTDRTLPSGAVGLWVEGDGEVAFDDVRVGPL